MLNYAGIKLPNAFNKKFLIIPLFKASAHKSFVSGRFRAEASNALFLIPSFWKLFSCPELKPYFKERLSDRGKCFNTFYTQIPFSTTFERILYFTLNNLFYIIFFSNCFAISAVNFFSSYFSPVGFNFFFFCTREKFHSSFFWHDKRIYFPKIEKWIMRSNSYNKAGRWQGKQLKNKLADQSLETP